MLLCKAKISLIQHQKHIHKRKKKINWISSKFKTSDTEKTVKIMKCQTGRKYLLMINIIRNLYSKYIKNSQKSIIRDKAQFLKWKKILKGHFNRVYVYKKEMHMNRCSVLLVIREIQIKTVRYQYIPLRMAKIKNTDHIECWRECGAALILIHQEWKWKMVLPLCKTV